MSNEEEQRSWHDPNTPTSPIFCTGESNYNKLEVEGPSSQSHNEDTDSTSLEERKETPRGELEEDGVKEDSDSSDKSKQQKRIRSTELHNHNERLRRQRLKEKMKALQELIPNCSKRDKSSTFDDAIKYIKSLQNQVQVMARGAGYSTFNSPETMISSTAPFLQTCLPRTGILHHNEMRMGMEKSAPLDFATGQSHARVPNPYFLPSSAPLGLLASDGFSATQGPLEFTLCPTSLESQSHGSSPSSQGTTSEQSSARRRESTARVLPSKIVQPHHSKEE